MHTVQHKIHCAKVRMKELSLDAYIIPSCDPHLSEYIPLYWECRKWISGFTGSAGTLVITQNKSGLWTDGRYFIQAEKELAGSGIILFKMGQEGTPTYEQWLADVLTEDNCVGIFGKLFPVSVVRKLEEEFTSKRIRLCKEYDLIYDLWSDRPSLPSEPVRIHDIAFSGRSAVEKLNDLRGEMAKKKATHHLICSLDDIAWLYNFRGGDIPYNPVTLSYAIISQDQAWLFLDKDKVVHQSRNIMDENGVSILAYEEIHSALSALTREDTILLEAEKTNSWLYDAIPKDCRIIEDKNITTGLKAIKNPCEIEHLKNCHVQDGLAMIRFTMWLEKNIEHGGITEKTVGEKLKQLRLLQEHSMGPSFPTIAGYKDHAAMMHYQAVSGNDYSIKNEGMLLIDSGGQYLNGTTDITRTLVLGSISDEEKKDFTLVLKGHINLAKAIFLSDATGSNLDILARQPLWEAGIDYKCGTGHGVGFYLNVHEGPQGFSQVPNAVKLKPGMILTNEPGIYREGKHGVRIENQMIVTVYQNTEFGQFLRFEPLTLCPIDRNGVDVSLLSAEERKWLNAYHQKVYAALAPHLDLQEQEWLTAATMPFEG